MRKPRPAVVILLALILAGTSVLAWAAAAAVDPAQPAAVDSQPVRRVSSDEKPDFDLLKAVDDVFATVVKWIETALFYRVGATERQYIQLDDQEHYWRPAGADASTPFVRVDPDGTYPDNQLTREQVDALEAIDELIPGPRGTIRRGQLNGNPVEFVAVKTGANKSTRNAKYVWIATDGQVEYRRQLPKRERLSDEPQDRLTEQEVAQLAALGRLKTRDDPKQSKLPPWLLTESAGGMPLVVAWLVLGGVFFTGYFTLFNLRGFRHSLQVIRGQYDDPTRPGEVSHFQALSSALSATVGLGNIGGVTIAMTIGGPGAFFWMLVCGLLGMSSKFVECTLGQKYRIVKPDGTVQGGPMEYLRTGLREIGLPRLGLVLSILFAVMCLMASFGGGNMYQVNQSGAAVLTVIQDADQQRLMQARAEIERATRAGDRDALVAAQAEKRQLQEKMSGFSRTFSVGYGMVMAVLVALVIIGGIRRIGAATSRIVPAMCGIYVLACVYIIAMHATRVPELIAQIFTDAFNGQAFGGGLLGVIVVGFQRAAFSNEAGVGSAAIAHSAARTDEPVREGVVALMEPFIDTIIVCSMTALVILITGAWDNQTWIVQDGLEGAALTTRAFKEELWWFPYVLAVSVVLFAYSTVISWSYYGERSWERLFGANSTIVYKVLCILFVFIGSIVNLGAVLSFSDIMILSMAFPNILGAILLAPMVKRDLADYWSRYKRGEMDGRGASGRESG